MNLARALHRVALLAYPTAFRDRFGDELQRIFEARIVEPGRRSTAAHGFLIAYLLADAVTSGLGERYRRAETAWAWPRHTDQFHTRRSRTMTWESISNDLRLAARQFRRAPLFAALTVASLALGIGANSAMFGVVNAVLLQPLPYKDPGALVMVWSDNVNASAPSNPVSPADFEGFKAAPSFAVGRSDVLVPAERQRAHRGTNGPGAGDGRDGHAGHVHPARAGAAHRHYARRGT